MGARPVAALDHAGIGEELRGAGVSPHELVPTTGRTLHYWRGRFTGGVPLTLEDLVVIAETIGLQVADLAAHLAKRLDKDNPGRIRGSIVRKK